ncbi:MAG TPA: insulinase family protein [Ignavibacteriaceae bacterium]|nr:insulinase family protein [Ignavibacteriaceae bacterium]
MKNRILTLILLFVFAVPSFAQVDRSQKPEAGPAPEINLGKYESFELPNGLKVFVVENHKLPRVAYSLVINRDPILEGDQSGYLEATGNLLRTGTKTKTKDQLDQEIDFIGATLSTSSSGVFAMSLKDHTEKLLSIMSDIVLNSDFKQTELDKIKKRMQSGLAAQKDDPSAIAATVESALLYGKNHPYGEVETEQTVDSITLKKCKDYYSTFFAPNISYLAIVGDITLEEAKPLVEKCFGSWTKKVVPEFKYKTPQAPTERKVALVDRPNSVQSVVEVGYPVQLKRGDPDLIKAKVANTILGGGVFRLFENLREKHSYTYGAYSSLSQDKIIGSFIANAEVRNSVTDSSITQILYEMNRIRTEAVPESELQTAKNYLTGNFAIALEQPQTIANFALNIARYNLPKDYYQNYLKNISTVTSADVMEAAKKYIKPDNAYVLVVGKASDVESGLKQFGPITLYDRFGDKVDTTKNKAPEGITAKDVINKYINALGGKANLEKVQDKTTIMRGSVQGMNITMMIYQKAPNKMKQEMDAGVMKQDVYFDGKIGVMAVGENTQEITGNALENMKYEALIHPLFIIDSVKVNSKLDKVAKVNGKDAYKVEMSLPDGKTWVEYFDTSSGLKVKDSKQVTVPQGTFTRETEYSDYRNVDGVMYPFKLKQSIGQQVLDFSVSSIKVNTGLKDDKFEIKK